MTDNNFNHPCEEAISNADTPAEVDLPMIDPLNLEKAEKTADMIDEIFAKSGYNARRLAEAAKIYRKMIDADATICLTLAGAMTPIGMSGVINSLIRAGFIDCIISTGANLYHDLHRPFDRPMMQGHFDVDDNELADTGIARIYDVFIEDEDTLIATDQIILETVEAMDLDKPMSTAEFHHALGLQIAKKAQHPDWSILAVAAEHNIPIYTSSPGDSSIAMNLAVPHMFGKKIQLDILKDVIETAAIVRSAQKNGVVVVGGGSPKNFYFQTQPTLQQIFRDESKGGHDYVIQLTTDAPHWGGLSGATISEAKSWGKVKDGHSNSVVVYSCASITLPLLAQYVLVRNQPRPSKKLFARLQEMTNELYQAVKNNPKFAKSMEHFQHKYDI